MSQPPQDRIVHLRLTISDGHQPLDVEVRAAGPVPWDQVLARLPLRPAEMPAWAVAGPDGAGQHRLGPDSAVGLPPLLHGAVVTAGSGSTPCQNPTTPVEVRVSEGPDCGRSLTLRAGAFMTIGRGAQCDLRICDPDLSRHHLTITSTRGGVIVEDAASTNGTWLDGLALDEPAAWPAGSRLALGSTHLDLVPAWQERLPVHPDGRGHGRFTPRSRHRPVLEEVAFSLPDTSLPQRRPMPPLLSWLLPLVISGLLAWVLRMPMLLLFGLMAPALAIGTYLGDRRAHRRETEEAHERHTAAVASIRARAHRAVQAELARRRARTPDLAHLRAQVVGGPTPEVWSVPLSEEADLRARVGTGPQAAMVHLDDECLSLAEAPLEVGMAGGLGLVGPADLVRALARAVLCQLLVEHGPDRLTLGLAGGSHGLGAEWEWLSWAPHASSETADPDAVEVALIDLHVRPGSIACTLSERSTVLVLAADATSLPDLATVVEVSAPNRMRLLRIPEAGSTTGDAHGHRPDLVGRAVANSIVRGLAPWRLRPGGHPRGSLPASAHFTEIHPDDLSARAMAQRWAAVPRSTCLALGLDGDGVCALDLAVDGPHALVGGTTGSGKSELLRTLVASLAVVNRPDELVFVLVDYKGGAAFAEAADLPHTVGLITDLDPHLANRALTSLTAELKRRERLMARGGARDLDEYQSRGQGPGLARLVLVIDEFRALAEELPAFLDGLVRIAALGRSLGVHLVLATQRPGGIVSADVRANVNLRIALRVRDASDSHDVIDCPDAAALPERLPGRALVRTGVEPPRAVQVARVIEPEKASPPASDLQVRVLDTLWPDPPDQRPAAASPPPGQQAASSTDEPTSLLERIATSTRLAAELVGAAPPPSPWLAALPDFVPVARLAEQLARDQRATDTRASGREVVGQTRACAAPVLLLDLPARQVQRPVTWDPLVDGHLAVVGAPRSGRTTLARTAVAGLVKRCSPAALHVYGFDFGGGMSPVATLPHTGAWVEGEEVARGARVLDGLAAIVAQRRRDVAAAGATSVLEAAGRAGEAMPVLAVVIDGWPQFVEAYGELGRGRLLEVTHQLLRDGPAMGLVALVTGDRTLLTARVSALLPQLWSLRMVDPADLLMAGLSRAQIPDRMPPGRVVRLSDGAVGQVAVIGDAPDGVAQVGALLSLAQQVGGGPDPSAEAPPGGPWTVRRLPRQVSLADLPQSVVPDPPMGSVDGEVTRSAGGLVVGLGGDDASPVCLPVDPAIGGTALVAGPQGSGRSTTLRTIAAAATSAGLEVLDVDPDRSEAVDVQDRLGGLGRASVVLVDDVSRIADTPTEDALMTWAAGLRAHGGALVVAGDTEQLAGTYRGIVPLVTRSRTGILLQPAGPADGAVLGVAPAGGDLRVPGRGVVVHRGRMTPVQVAVPG